MDAQNYIVNTVNNSQNNLLRAVPPIAGIILIAMFAKLGMWQLDRANQKNEMRNAFENPSSYVNVADAPEPTLFTAIEATGRYQPDTQILIDNVIVDGRLGYYVISPLEYSRRAPLLLVNRGWLEKQPGGQPLPDMAVPEETLTVRGKSGRLPRVGIRPGEAFADPKGWPRIGVWPTADEISTELGRDVKPYVLLLDADQQSGFVRRWEPQQSGALTHYGYAFQWFAMAIAVLTIGVWTLRKGWNSSER